MRCNKRIYYIDYCEKDCRIANAGFLKLIYWRKRDCSEEMCLQICISGMMAEVQGNGEICLVSGEERSYLGQVKLADGRGIVSIGDFDRKWEELAEKSGEAILLQIVLKSEVYFECKLKEAANNSIKYIDAESVKKELDIEIAETQGNVGEKVLAGIRENTETREFTGGRELEQFAMEESQEQMDCVNDMEEKKNMDEIPRMKAEKWKQLWEMFPHIQPFADDREYMKLCLEDMLVLSEKYYRLVENSFLLHGYYNYGHVVLAKIYLRGQEKIGLGVPGNYYEKEAQVAVLFGFESFEPKTEPAREGDFGYYFISVDI